MVNAAVVQNNGTHGEQLSDDRVTSSVIPFGVLPKLEGQGFEWDTVTLCPALTLILDPLPSSRTKIRESVEKRLWGERLGGLRGVTPLAAILDSCTSQRHGREGRRAGACLSTCIDRRCSGRWAKRSSNILPMVLNFDNDFPVGPVGVTNI